MTCDFIPNLSKLDISNNFKLKTIAFTYSDIKSLDVSHNLDLEQLYGDDIIDTLYLSEGQTIEEMYNLREDVIFIYKDIIEVNSVELNHQELTICPDETVSLVANIIPNDATTKKIEFSSDNDEVATVDQFGCVTGISVGKAKITAKAIGDICSYCNVIVDPKSIKLNKTELTMHFMDTDTLVATILPEKNTNKVIWHSSNVDIVHVSTEGVITGGQYNGTAIITATCGTMSDSCIVVVEPILADSVILDYSSLNLSLGEFAEIHTTTMPVGCVCDYTWTSSDENVVKVLSERGWACLVVAVGYGSAVITATATDGTGVSASCEIKVSPILVESIELNYYYCELEEGESIWLEATVLPEDATNKEIEWTSSDEDVVKVNESGYVTFVGFGDAVVTATAKDGSGVYATCVFTNIDGIEYIYIDGNVGIYTLDGKKVQNAGKGVYIINGKKILK